VWWQSKHTNDKPEFRAFDEAADPVEMRVPSSKKESAPALIRVLRLPSCDNESWLLDRCRNAIAKRLLGRLEAHGAALPRGANTNVGGCWM
jgi:hypothetical protein